MNLQEKRILFFAPKFFGYEKAIIDTMTQMGLKVDYFDERPSNSFLCKALIRINRSFLKYKIKRYYDQILENIKNTKYDYIFVVNLESMYVSILSDIKKQFPDAKTVLYMWDSFANKKNALRSISHFDKVLSFDRNDSQKYELQFRPLFYIEEYNRISKRREYNYDVLFVGTIHSDRYCFIKNIEKQLKSKELNTYFYFFFKSSILYYKEKILNKSFWNTSKSDFRFLPLSKQKLLELIDQSRILIDVQHPNQTGLTIRTIEALGAKKKLITTNKEIKEYDFYNPNNILVVNRFNPIINPDFILTPYHDLEDEIYNSYSIKSWIKDILS